MPANVSINSASINIRRNLSINQDYFFTAVRRTNVRKRSVFQQLLNEINTVSPQDLGNMANRIVIRNNMNKTPQDRFFDIFV